MSMYFVGNKKRIDNQLQSESACFCELRFVQRVEVWMVHCLQSRNALVWVEGAETSEKVDFQFVESRSVIAHGHAPKLREGGLEVGKLECIWPVPFIWCAEDLEYFEDLVNLTVSHK